MENTTHSLDYVAMLRRRRWWLIVPIVLALAIGLALVRFLPKQYQAEATLGVAAPSVSPSLVNQSAVIDNQERLRALTHQLLSDKVLQRVVVEEGLGVDAEPWINRLRRQVTISVPEPVSRSLDDARRLDAFRVAYQDSDPAVAQRLTNRLATVFIEEHSQSRTHTAEKSSAYLEAERDRAKAQLVVLEERLRRAKEAYVGRLPEQTQANLQTLTSLRQQLESNATSLRHQQDRLSLLRRQIETLEQDAAKGIAVAGAGSAVPDRVTTLERDLAAARAMYTERHPEVQRLDAELKTALQEAVAPAPRPTVDLKARLQVDPNYRQLLADRDATTLGIRDLEHTAATIRGQIADYQSRVEAAPMVEQQLASVQREYDFAQSQYADLSSKVANASVAESVARNRDGEQFALLYPASLPDTPVSPIPSRLLLFALMGGLCVGGALALGREYLDASVHSSRDLADEFEVPVLGEVGHLPATSR
jgi:polysaccharide chain length determinant protein (PEP-CTERM system associated)